jgi:hypothetical protein
VVLSALEGKDVAETARVCMEAFNTLHMKNLGRHLDFGLWEVALGFHHGLVSHPKVREPPHSLSLPLPPSSWRVQGRVQSCEVDEYNLVHTRSPIW